MQPFNRFPLRRVKKVDTGFTQHNELCEGNGSKLLYLKYYNVLYLKPYSVAILLLRSHQEVMISVGIATAKIFRRSAVFGFLAPRCLAEKSLMEWQPDYAYFNSFQRGICQMNVFDGLIVIVSRAGSIAELSRTWHTIPNPLHVSA